METKNATGIVKHIPNFITSLNVFSGSCAIVFAFSDKLHIAAICILIAAVFDFLDGLAARLLHAYSAMGKELDSLADVVSFGVAPAAIVFNLFMIHQDTYQIMFLQENSFFYFSAFIIAVFSALRLAKFNIDTRQTTSFIGMPTPANAIFWASFPLILYYNPDSFISNILVHPYVLFGLIIISSFLLISEIPMFSLKMKSFKFSENYTQYIFLILSIILFVFLNIIAIPFVILLYIITSIFFNLIIKNT